MATIVTPFRASHLEGIADVPQARDFAAHPSETLWDSHGQVVACYGCVLASPGRGVFWLALGPTAHQRIFGLIRQMKRGWWTVMHRYKLHRLEVVVDPTNRGAVELVQYLGFEREVEMRGYAPDGSSREQWVWLCEKERDHVR